MFFRGTTKSSLSDVIFMSIARFERHFPPRKPRTRVKVIHCTPPLEVQNSRARVHVTPEELPGHASEDYFNHTFQSFAAYVLAVELLKPGVDQDTAQPIHHTHLRKFSGFSLPATEATKFICIVCNFQLYFHLPVVPN